MSSFNHSTRRVVVAVACGLGAARAFTLDLTNRRSACLDLFTVEARHQDALIESLVQRAETWKRDLPDAFLHAGIHASTDGARRPRLLLLPCMLGTAITSETTP